MPNGSMKTCLYFDSSIVVTYVLNQYPFISRVNKFLNDRMNRPLTCYVSDSVVEESKDKLLGTIIRTGIFLKNLLEFYLESERQKEGRSPSNPLIRDDMKCLERAFVRIYATKSIIIDVNRAVEEWIINYLDEKIALGPVDLDDFFVDLIAELLDISAKLRTRFDDAVLIRETLAKKKTLARSRVIEDSLVQEGIHRTDAIHLASVADEAIRNQNLRIVFVTIDYRSILNKRAVIKSVCGLTCTDPLYTIYYT